MKSTGHFISMPRGATQAAMLDPLSREGVAGLQVRYMWKELEPQYGMLTLDRVKSDAALARRYGKTLVALLEDKTFGKKEKPAENPMPDYMAEYTIPNRQYGYTSARWRGNVVTRLMWISAALRDADILVAFQETAPGIPDAELQQFDYLAETYVRAIIDLSAECDFLYTNFIPKGQGELGRIIRESACPVGGPDVLPDDEALTTHVYPHFAAAPNRVRRFSSMQHNSYRHQRADGLGLWNLDELVAWASEVLRVETLFWNIPWAGMEGHTIEDAYAAIARRPVL